MNRYIWGIWDHVAEDWFGFVLLDNNLNVFFSRKEARQRAWNLGMAFGKSYRFVARKHSRVVPVARKEADHA